MSLFRNEVIREIFNEINTEFNGLRETETLLLLLTLADEKISKKRIKFLSLSFVE